MATSQLEHRAVSAPDRPVSTHGGILGVLASRSLVARVVFFNLCVFLLVSVAIFAILDHYQTRVLVRRTDHFLESEILVFTAEMEGLFQSRDEDQWRQALNRFSRALGISRVFFRILTSEGMELAASDLKAWPGLRDHPAPLNLIGERPIVWESAPVSAAGARIVYYHDPGGLILQIGIDLAERRAEIKRARVIFGNALGALLFFGTLFSWLAARRALVGIRRVTATAAAIRAGGDLGVRTPYATGSLETDELARTMDAMLDRINGLIVNLRQVMDNIAHDIKTPVTRMRMSAETDLRRGEISLVTAGNVIEECDHIMNLISRLLEITAAESGLANWHIENVNLTDLIHEGCELFVPVFENAGLELDLDLNVEVWAWTDRRMMQRVIANLIDNAVKYTPAGGLVGVGLATQAGMARIWVRDTGVGIAAEEIPRIFDRFYRCDRSRALPGNGLGLSFCRAALAAHGGSISCQSELDRGTVFYIDLPLVSPWKPSGT